MNPKAQAIQTLDRALSALHDARWSIANGQPVNALEQTENTVELVTDAQAVMRQLRDGGDIEAPPRITTRVAGLSEETRRELGLTVQQDDLADMADTYIPQRDDDGLSGYSPAEHRAAQDRIAADIREQTIEEQKAEAERRTA